MRGGDSGGRGVPRGGIESGSETVQPGRTGRGTGERRGDAFGEESRGTGVFGTGFCAAERVQRAGPGDRSARGAGGERPGGRRTGTEAADWRIPGFAAERAFGGTGAGV